MRIFITADMIRKTVTGMPQACEKLAIATPSDIGAGIRFRIIVKVKNIGDGLGKQGMILLLVFISTATTEGICQTCSEHSKVSSILGMVRNKWFRMLRMCN